MPTEPVSHLPMLRHLAALSATAALVLMLLWSTGLIICQPVCALPLLPVAGLIYWHWKLKSKLSLRKWLWVYVIAQVTIFLALPEPHHETWEPLGAKAPCIRHEYDRLHIENIRHFRYRTAEDFDIRYEDEHLRLSDIVGASYAEALPDSALEACRPMLSFELRSGKHLVVAPEMRRPVGKLTPLQAWYKCYGLLYIFSTEADIFRYCTDIRGEQLHVFPLQITTRQAQNLFRACIALNRQSSAYHPLWARYASGIARVLRTVCPDIPQWVPYDGRHLARRLYETGCLQVQADEDFTSLCKRCTVSSSLVAPTQEETYSDALRRHIGVPQHTPQDSDAEDAVQQEIRYKGKTGIIFSGDRFREDIPEPGKRSDIPYQQSQAAGRAATIPEPRARLEADYLRRAQQQKGKATKH